MIIDLHCHCTFSRRPPATADRFRFESRGCLPADGACRPTDFDSCLSPRVVARPLWRLARWWLGLPPPGAELDRVLAAEYERHFGAPGPIERYVLLAFDAVHDDEGRCVPLPNPGDRLGSDLYTSNSLVRDVCRRHPKRFLFGASVHPYRADAVAAVAEVFAAGACLLKWLPLHHNIDVTDARTLAVMRRCAALGLPLLVHYGPEFTLATQRPALRSIRPLLDVLRTLRRERCMPTTIVAHLATPVLPWEDRDSYRALVAALVGEFADAPLYADLAALVTWAKMGYLRWLRRHPELHAKLLFGTDFPVPPTLGPLAWTLGAAGRRAAKVAAWPQRAAGVCRALGLSEIVLHRAAELLPNVDYFTRSGREMDAQGRTTDGRAGLPASRERSPGSPDRDG